jgi:hypothetical protein
MFVIQTLWRLRKEDGEFYGGLGYIVRPVFKNKEENIIKKHVFFCMCPFSKPDFRVSLNDFCRYFLRIT